MNSNRWILDTSVFQNVKGKRYTDTIETDIKKVHKDVTIHR